MPIVDALMAYLNSITRVEGREGLIANYSVHVLEACKSITNSGLSGSHETQCECTIQ
jgi:hypothetical protein